jgi:uncharacterized protein (DUF58 family)
MKHPKQGLPRLGKLLLFLLVLCLSWLPAVFYAGAAGYLPGLMVTMLSLLCLMSLLWLKRGLIIDTKLGNASCMRGGELDLGLTLKNRSPISPSAAKAYLTLSDLFGQEDRRACIPFALTGRGSVTFDFGMELHHIGRYQVGLEYLELQGPLGVASIRVPLEGKFTALVTPRLRPMEELRLESLATAEATTNTRVTIAGGTDYTGVRDYALGDPMKQIHWKLSAHTRSYLTKMQESNRQQEFAVILDFAADAQPDRELMMDLNDCLIEVALSLVEEISHLDGGNSLLYCDRGGNMARWLPHSREDGEVLVEEFAFLRPQPQPDFPDAVELLRREGRGQNRSTNVLLVTTRLTPDLVQELQRIKRQGRSPSLYYIYPGHWNSRQLSQAMAPLAPLEEAEIPYYPISTQTNALPTGQREGAGGEGL